MGWRMYIGDKVCSAVCARSRCERWGWSRQSVVVDAIRWMGGTTAEIEDFCGLNWGRADAHDVGWGLPDDGEQLIVWNTQERQWLCVQVGSWIVRGAFGELYPCAGAAFAETYERAQP